MGPHVKSIKLKDWEDDLITNLSRNRSGAIRRQSTMALRSLYKASERMETGFGLQSLLAADNLQFHGLDGHLLYKICRKNPDTMAAFLRAHAMNRVSDDEIRAALKSTRLRRPHGLALDEILRPRQPAAPILHKHEQGSGPSKDTSRDDLDAVELAKFERKLGSSVAVFLSKQDRQSNGKKPSRTVATVSNLIVATIPKKPSAYSTENAFLHCLILTGFSCIGDIGPRACVKFLQPNAASFWLKL